MAGISGDLTAGSKQLARIGFYLSLLLFLYGTLFPFNFDFSPTYVRQAWAHADLDPFWDAARGRIQSLPDIVSNTLLTIPIGFLGLLTARRGTIWKWGAVTLALGATVEALQLGIPGRTSSLTDVLSQAMGGVAGAGAARLFGQRLLQLLTGGWRGPAQAWLLILLLVIVVTKFGPFDVTLDVSSIRSDVRHFLDDPWDLDSPPKEEWDSLAQFILLGALTGSLVRSGDLPRRLTPAAAITSLLLLPCLLEAGQLFVVSHAPSLRDAGMDTAGALAGLAMVWRRPGFLRPQAGLAIVGLGVLAAGLNPYRFVPWDRRSHFEFVPLVEYYRNTTAAALYDAGIGLVSFALFGALLEQSCRCRRWIVAGAAAGFAAIIELIQLNLPGRYAGTTDIIIAGLGAWVGAFVSQPIRVTDARQAADESRSPRSLIADH